MAIKMILDGGIEERAQIPSGLLYTKGSSPKYGVLFTCNDDHSDDDMGLDPGACVGAFIGKQNDPETEADRFLTILGGYYFRDNFPAPGTTVKVFGIARDPEFGITEGGTVTLKDNWKLDDPEKPNLDEQQRSREDKRRYGWTFIVELADKSRFPRSRTPLKIFKVFECPQVSPSLGHTISDKDENTKSVEFAVRYSGEAPGSYRWDCGDGTPVMETSTPTLRHDYPIPAAETKTYAASVECLGPEDCRATARTTIELERKVVQPPEKPEIPCPSLTRIACDLTSAGETVAAYRLTAHYKGAKPDKLIWTWGDGSQNETTEPTATHSYRLAGAGTHKFSATVTAVGPRDCTTSQNVTVEVAEPPVVRPPYCAFLAPLVATFAGIAMCALLVLVAGGGGEEANVNQDPVGLVLGAFAVLAAGTLGAWLAFLACPQPSRQDWLGIGWAALLAGFLLLAFAYGAAWLWLTLAMLAIGGILFYLWLRGTMAKGRGLVMFGVPCLLAFLVTYVLFG